MSRPSPSCGAPGPHTPALTFHLLRLQLSATISPSAQLSSGFSILQLADWFNPYPSHSYRSPLTASLKDKTGGSYNSCWDKAALGCQSRGISPHGRSAFCSHWRHMGSRETVVKESFIICLEKTAEQSVNQGHRDCSSPRIGTYLLAAAPWKRRSEPPWGKRGDQTQTSQALCIKSHKCPRGACSISTFLWLCETEKWLLPNHVQSLIRDKAANSDVETSALAERNIETHTEGQF